ncbi:MAG: hypothetical protein RIS36_446 [Pseudomonadota bacterium]
MSPTAAIEKSSTSSFTFRRLQRAVRHVNCLWFPFNPTVVEEIESAGLYEFSTTDPSRVLSVIRKDAALLGFVLVRLLRERADAPLNPNNPAALISRAGPTRIKGIVAEGLQTSSAHKLQSSQPFQLSRLAETMIAASTVEALCKGKNFDPLAGFCKVILRDLGMNLIAWNYPSVYKEVLDSVDTQRVEDAIERSLGFSPRELAHVLTLAPKQGGVVATTPLDPADQIFDHYISVGEALARAEFPETYSSSREDWSYASKYLSENLGRDFSSTIRNVIVANSSAYYKMCPTHFKRLVKFDPARHHGARPGLSRIVFNPFVKECSVEIQEALRALYDTMPDGTPDRASLSAILTTLIPKAGFTGGCLFVANKRSGILTPGRIIGRVRAMEVGPVPLWTSQESYSNKSSFHQAKSPQGMVERAFVTRRPITERFEHTVETQENPLLSIPITRFSATVGDKRPMGVLYLEKPFLNVPEEDKIALPTFRALNKTLSDALCID